MEVIDTSGAMHNKIKPCRRVAVGYDRLAAEDVVFILLAPVTLYPRVNEFTRGVGSGDSSSTVNHACEEAGVTPLVSFARPTS